MPIDLKEQFKEYAEFLHTMPPDQKIDHYSWQTCAVGEFRRYQGDSFKRLDTEYEDDRHEMELHLYDSQGGRAGFSNATYGIAAQDAANHLQRMEEHGYFTTDGEKV